MAKKLSYADLTADRDRLAMREHILSIAAAEMVPDSTYRHHDGRDVYTWKAYRLAGASGGYLVCVFRGFINGYPTVYYVERLDVAIEQVQQRYASFADCGMCDAVYKFTNERAVMMQRTA